MDGIVNCLLKTRSVVNGMYLFIHNKFLNKELQIQIKSVMQVMSNNVYYENFH